MKKIAITLSCIFFIFCSACKKEKTPTPANTSSTDYYDGILTANIQGEVYMGTVDTMFDTRYGSAWFGFTPFPEASGSNANFVTVDSVSLNNTYFKFSSYSYQDSTYYISHFPPVNWHVVGNHGIPSFNFTNTNVFPAYSGYLSFPDSIEHTQGITFPISGISNATRLIISITDGLDHYATKEISVSSTSVTFDASSLSSLIPSQNCYLTFWLRNENAQSFGGKKFRFDNVYALLKGIKIK